MELLSTLTRRQHEHRARTVSRLTAVLDADLLPADLQEMVLYYRAKALRDTGRAAQTRRDYQQVADQGGRLGLAHAARLAGDFPTALAAAQNLGWEGRHQRVMGDLYWLQG
ncbi:ATP/GTP-binding protein, partial [Streptomyces sp. NPDC059340]